MTVKKVSDSFELPLESKKELCDAEYVCENLQNRTSTFHFVDNSEILHADAVKCLHWKRIEQVNSGVDPVVAQRASRIAGHIAYKFAP